MDYTFQHQLLSQLFSLEKENIKIPGSNLNIKSLEFTSDFKIDESLFKSQSSVYFGEDAQIAENWNFRYPVFIPVEKKNNKTIILLHGLNERDWNKYLVWAKYLTEKTGRSVVLFPLAFHINRGKKEWSDPRLMSTLANSRKSSFKNIAQLSFANAALSSRLTEDPLRFYRAGLQSAQDLIQLISQIKRGTHPLFEKNTHINFMGYSIGALLTQILFIANPDKIFKDSKAALFCGGSTFNHMSGTSKLIMDNLAYENLNNFYMNQFGRNILTEDKSHRSNQLQIIVQAFKAMIPIPAFNRLKEKRFSRLSKRITTIGLLKDRVIPAKDILETLKTKKGKMKFRFQMLDFPYHYSHENPFPVFNNEDAIKVDKSFELVFSQIANNLK